MPVPASATSVGAGRSAKPASPRPATRQRKSASSSGSKKTVAGGGSSSAGMWKFYTEDSPGVKVGPVPVLVMSLTFIASVFVLHIWGKYMRG